MDEKKIFWAILIFIAVAFVISGILAYSVGYNTGRYSVTYELLEQYCDSNKAVCDGFCTAKAINDLNGNIFKEKT